MSPSRRSDTPSCKALAHSSRVAIAKEETSSAFLRAQDALIKQYVALLETEGVKLNITDDAVNAIAKFATSVNESTENIGARRLHTILERFSTSFLLKRLTLREKRESGFRVCSQTARRNCEKSGSEPLHPVKLENGKSKLAEPRGAVDPSSRIPCFEVSSALLLFLLVAVLRRTR